MTDVDLTFVQGPCVPFFLLPNLREGEGTQLELQTWHLLRVQQGLGRTGMKRRQERAHGRPRLQSPGTPASLLVLRGQEWLSERHHAHPRADGRGCHVQPLTLGPRASRVRARSLLACVSAMSARSSASSNSCWALRYLARLVLACCSWGHRQVWSPFGH